MIGGSRAVRGLLKWTETIRSDLQNEANSIATILLWSKFRAHLSSATGCSAGYALCLFAVAETVSNIHVHMCKYSDYLTNNTSIYFVPISWMFGICAISAVNKVQRTSVGFVGTTVVMRNSVVGKWFSTCTCSSFPSRSMLGMVVIYSIDVLLCQIELWMLRP